MILFPIDTAFTCKQSHNFEKKSKGYFSISQLHSKTKLMYSPKSLLRQNCLRKRRTSHVCSQETKLLLLSIMLLRMHVTNHSRYCRGISDELNALRFIGGGGGGFLALWGHIKSQHLPFRSKHNTFARQNIPRRWRRRSQFLSTTAILLRPTGRARKAGRSSRVRSRRYRAFIAVAIIAIQGIIVLIAKYI